MHKHLYVKKSTRKVHRVSEVPLTVVKYECGCGEWWKRQIKPGQKAPVIWSWEIFSDQPVKMENTSSSASNLPLTA